jgi:hypothetical protein
MFLGMAVVRGALSHRKSAFSMNSESLLFNKPHFIEESQSGKISLLSGPCTFSKYLLAHSRIYL